MQSICTKIALSTLTFFVILSTQAATITSVQSGNWSNNNTWDCNCVPVAGDNVIIGTHIVTVNQIIRLQILKLQLEELLPVVEKN